MARNERTTVFYFSKETLPAACGDVAVQRLYRPCRWPDPTFGELRWAFARLNCRVCHIIPERDVARCLRQDSEKLNVSPHATSLLRHDLNLR